MNKYNRAAINHFLDQTNARYCMQLLSKAFNDNHVVVGYLRATMHQHVMNYGQMLERDFLVTDIINRAYKSNNQDIRMQVACINTQFIEYMREFIEANVLKTRIPTSVMTNYNDAIKTNARSAVDNMARQRLCDTDTRDVDNPARFFGDKPIANVHLEHGGDNPRFRRQDGQCAVANNHLDRTWYAYRAQQIRDDPAGEIVRDRMAANQRMSHGHNESFRQASTPHNHNSKRMGNGGEGYQNAPPQQTPQTHIIHHGANLREDQNGNLLHDAEYGNVSIGTKHSYNGTPDTTELGDYNNMLTGESPEYSGDHVDRLLTTRYIQNLNSDSEDRHRDIYDNSSIQYPGVMTAMQAANRGYRDVTVEGMQNTEDAQSLKLWSDGDFIFNEDDPAEMNRFMGRRSFRSLNKPRNKCKQCELGTCSTHTLAEKVLNDYKTDDADGQIPFYERALYKRNYERDVDEAVGGFETEGINRGYGKDLDSMYCRIPSKYPCGDNRNQVTTRGGIERTIPPGNPEWTFNL